MSWLARLAKLGSSEFSKMPWILNNWRVVEEDASYQSLASLALSKHIPSHPHMPTCIQAHMHRIRKRQVKSCIVSDNRE